MKIQKDAAVAVIAQQIKVDQTKFRMQETGKLAALLAIIDEAIED